MDGYSVVLLCMIVGIVGMTFGGWCVNRQWLYAEELGIRREHKGKLYNVFDHEDADYLVGEALLHETEAYDNAIHACITIAGQFATRASQAVIINEYDIYRNQCEAAKACALWIQRMRDGQDGEMAESADCNIVALGHRAVGGEGA